METTNGENAVKITLDYICPKCSWETMEGDGLTFKGTQYEGTYCIQCWAKWASENLTLIIKKSI